MITKLSKNNSNKTSNEYYYKRDFFQNMVSDNSA